MRITLKAGVALMLATGLSGCLRLSEPFGFTGVHEPVDGTMVLHNEVKVVRCRELVFGIPIGPPYTSRELVHQARGEHDGLIRMSWDKSLEMVLFYQKRCDILYATPVDWVSDSAGAVTRRSSPRAASAAASSAAPSSVEEPAPATHEPLRGSGPATPGTPVDFAPFDRGAGAGIDRMTGFDGHAWGASPWQGLPAAQSSFGTTFYEPEDRLQFIGQSVRGLRLTFAEGGLSEVRFRVAEPPQAELERAFGPPQVSVDGVVVWEGERVRFEIDGRKVTVTGQ